jgi:hypothetical protein
MSEPRIDLAELRRTIETDPGSFLHKDHPRQLLALIEVVQAAHAFREAERFETAPDAFERLSDTLSHFDFGDDT